jgi:CrcB protein
MEVEILKMVEADHYPLALAYALSSLAAGLLAIWLATTIVRRAQLA